MAAVETGYHYRDNGELRGKYVSALEEIPERTEEILQVPGHSTVSQAVDAYEDVRGLPQVRRQSGSVHQ